MYKTDTRIGELVTLLSRKDQTLALYPSVWGATQCRMTDIPGYVITEEWMMMYLSDYLLINPRDDRDLDPYIQTPLIVRDLITEEDIDYDHAVHFCLCCREPLERIYGVVMGEADYVWMGNLVVTLRDNEQWPTDQDVMYRSLDSTKQTYYMNTGGYRLYPMRLMKTDTDLYYYQRGLN